MVLIEWSNMLSVGVKNMDHQHQVLIGIINRLAATLNQGKAESDHNVLLGELMRYTLVNFESEAELMKRIGYEESVTHLQEHQGFVTKVLSFQERIAHHDKPDVQEFLIFLRNWWVGHILNNDHDFAIALNHDGIC